MEIKHLINTQSVWESQRGIKNGNWGVDRVQAELDEAKEETNLYKKLQEYADVLIILTGSIGLVVEELDLDAEVFESMVVEKLKTNEEKYPIGVFQLLPQDEAVALCRAAWRLKNDY